ncbi:MAG: SPOR domain-containing protein [Candidatus Margulisiibacteriota bacterium]
MSEPFETDNLENKTAPHRRFHFSKGFIPFVVLIVVVVGSFWISFELGMRILNGGNNNVNKIIPSDIPEVPPEIAKLQTNKVKLVKQPLKAVKSTAVINKPLAVFANPKRIVRTKSSGYYKVQAGYFYDQSSAKALAEKLLGDGFDTYVKKVGTGWRVQVGAYKTKKLANVMQNSLKVKGYSSKLIVE